MMVLVLGLIVFFAIHLVTTNRELRDGLVARLGGGPYKLVYSVISVIGLVLIVVGYHKMQLMVGSKNPVLWTPPEWSKPLAAAMMLVSFVLLVASQVPSRIRLWVGHPMLAGVMIWALAHLVSNGTVADVLLFGSFLVYAIYDWISVTRRGVGPAPADVPSGFINDAFVVVLGVAIFAVFSVWGHAYLIGVSPR